MWGEKIKKGKHVLVREDSGDGAHYTEGGNMHVRAAKVLIRLSHCLPLHILSCPTTPRTFVSNHHGRACRLSRLIISGFTDQARAQVSPFPPAPRDDIQETGVSL